MKNKPQQTVEEAAKDWVNSRQWNAPGVGIQGSFKAGVDWREANPSERELALVEALTFYAENNGHNSDDAYEYEIQYMGKPMTLTSSGKVAQAALAAWEKAQS